MAYGGGTFMTQNKVLPGAYIVFASVARATATISDRGVAAAPVALGWGPESVREITQGEFIRNCWDLFGYNYTDDEMLPLRELYKHAVKAFVYRLPAAGAARAKNDYAKAKYDGERGNDITIQVTKLDKIGDDPQSYLVETVVGTKIVDKQTVTSWADLKNNDFVDFTKTITVSEAVSGSFVKATNPVAENVSDYYTFALTEDLSLGTKTYYAQESATKYTAIPSADLDVADIATYYERSDVGTFVDANKGTYFEQEYEDNTYSYKFTGETGKPDVDYYSTTIGEIVEKLTGGDDGTIDGESYSAFLKEIEPYSFNTMCCPTTDQTIIGQFINNTKDMRDNYGIKYQLVCYKPSAADYEGVIGLWNSATHDTITVNEAAAVYWLTGAEAAAPINGSLTNTKYDGELNIAVDTRQLDLENHIKNGEFVFHRSNGDIVVLTDINSLVSLRENFGDMFQKNQTIRYCDNVANDLAALFVKRYLGIVQNDEPGRASWWNECVKYFRDAQRIRAITEFTDEIVDVDIGDEKDTVVTYINGLNIVNAMEKLYMTVICK